MKFISGPQLLPFRQHRFGFNGIEFVFGFVAFAAFACAGHATADTLGFGASGPDWTPPRAQQVLVFDSETGVPLNQAQISFASLAGEIPSVTASLDGFATTTLIGSRSSQIALYLQKLPTAQTDGQLRGELAPWDIPAQSSDVKAGLAFKALTPGDLINFSTESFISPVYDSIDVLGPRQIPSNLVLPPQEVPFLLGSISLNKPQYRLPTSGTRPARMVGIEGTVAVQDVISSVQSGNLKAALLNKLKFSKVGITESSQIESDTVVNIPVNHALTPMHEVAPDAAPFAGQMMIASATDLFGDMSVMIPTDIKSPSRTSGGGAAAVAPLQLANAKNWGASKAILTLAVGPKGARVSGILTRNAGAAVKPGAFLPSSSPKQPRPTWMARMAGLALPEKVEIAAPSEGVAVVSFESKFPTSLNPNRTAPVWFVYTLPSLGKVSVDTHAITSKQQFSGYSVMEVELAPGFTEKSVDGKTALQGLRRFNRNYVAL